MIPRVLKITFKLVNNKIAEIIKSDRSTFNKCLPLKPTTP